MTDEPSLRLFNYVHVPMLTGDPVNFRPDRVIHRVVSISARGKFEYVHPTKAYAWHPATSGTIEALIQRLAQGGANGDAEPAREVEALAIPIKGHAYVVMELDAYLPWFFDPAYHGITLGNLATASAADKHRAVWHYNPATRLLQEAACPKCRFVVFSTLLPDENHPQSINFNLIDGDGTKFTVDPDIRYPGTGGEVGGGP